MFETVVLFYFSLNFGVTNLVVHRHPAAAFSREAFSQNAPSLMFDRALNTLLYCPEKSLRK